MPTTRQRRCLRAARRIAGSTAADAGAATPDLRDLRHRVQPQPGALVAARAPSSAGRSSSVGPDGDPPGLGQSARMCTHRFVDQGACCRIAMRWSRTAAQAPCSVRQPTACRIWSCRRRRITFAMRAPFAGECGQFRRVGASVRGGGEHGAVEAVGKWRDERGSYLARPGDGCHARCSGGGPHAGALAFVHASDIGLNGPILAEGLSLWVDSSPPR